MNTPSHYILNLALLGKSIAPKANVAITIGAILPDIPIFVFYFVAKFIYKLPERQIWSEAYYEPFWQIIIALSHSLPLALIGLFISLYFGWKPGAIACVSMILHSLFDFPVHHDDAHRHFFPFSDYRFISPLSYWDPKHYGSIVAFVELSLVLAVTPLVFDLLYSRFAKVLVIVIELLYVVGYLRFYIF
ncbi:MAG: hypothetical protein AB4426_16065 [Xenococcaceae cyanobacterium]